MIARFPVKAPTLGDLDARAHAVANAAIDGRTYEERAAHKKAPGIKYTLQQVEPAQCDGVDWNDGQVRFKQWGAVYEVRYDGDEKTKRAGHELV